MIGAMLIASCANPFTQPDALVLNYLPPFVAQGFSDVQACVGRPSHVQFAQLTFLQVNAETFPGSRGQDVAGHAEFDGRVWIAAPYLGERSAWLWKHEMAHVMYRVSDHPADIFHRCILMPSQQGVDLWLALR